MGRLNQEGFMDCVEERRQKNWRLEQICEQQQSDKESVQW